MASLFIPSSISFIDVLYFDRDLFQQLVSQHSVGKPLVSLLSEGLFFPELLHLPLHLSLKLLILDALLSFVVSKARSLGFFLVDACFSEQFSQ